MMPYLVYGTAPIVQATVNVGDITTSFTPPSPGTLTISTVETLAGFTVSAGAYRVTIRNVGSAIEVGGNMGADENITVNGQTVPPGQEVTFSYVHDAANEEFLTLPAITVVNANGAGVWYRVES